MKIKKLKLNNFAKFTNFECEFDGNVTHLVGVNGSGKTTVGLTAIWACLKGIAEKSKDGQLLGERFRFIGAERPTADISLTVFDEQSQSEVTITNHISKSGNKITCHPIQDSDWLNNLLSVAFLSTKNFTQLSGKEQAILLGIDTSEHDAKIRTLKEAYTYINREYKNFGDIQSVESIDKVSISDLLRKKDDMDTFNYKQDDLAQELNSCSNTLASLENEEVTLLERLEAIKGSITEAKKDWDTMPKPQPKQDVSIVISQIQNAEATNQKAAEYETCSRKKRAKEFKADELRSNKKQQEEAEKAKISFIKSFNFGFDCLTVDENGELRMTGRPIKEPYFSKGELEIIVAKLYASRNPDLKVRFIDDFELLDEDNQTKLVNGLLKDGFQIITAEVGKATVKDNTLLLRECKIVETYENEKEALL